MAMSETKGQKWTSGELSTPTHWRKANDILTSTLQGTPFCSAVTQKGKWIERLI